MRTEKEMMHLILSFAQKDDRIRIVGMEGSRTNIHISKDSFQDFDISFLVTDLKSFQTDDRWLDYFGQRIIMQKPEAMSLFPPELGNWFSYLILFEDGNKMDLTLIPLEELALYLKSDGLLTILLDKDRRIAAPPAATDRDFWVQNPSPEYFDDCCNEFWFVSTYVCKGLCRREILFASEHLNFILRPNLLRMLGWKVGIETGFSLSVGKAYKFLGQYVDSQTWGQLLSTYRNDSYPNMWDALEKCHILFREAAHFVADSLGYCYPDYDRKVSGYIARLKKEYQ